MITTTGLHKTATKIMELLDHARYTMNGTTNDIPIYNSKVEGNALTVYVLFDNAYVGNLTKIELIDTDGDVYANQPDNIEKTDTKLLLVTFKFSVVEVVN